MKESKIKVNVVWNLIKTFSNIGFPLITFSYVSHVLLPESVGKYNFANTYVSYYALIASLGITTYAIRECSLVKDDNEKVSQIASQIFSINICSMIISYIAMFISLVLFRKLDPYGIVIVILSTNIFFTIIGADWLNTAFEDFKYITIRTMLFQMASLIALFVFVKKPSDYINYAVITAIASGGANIMNAFYRKKFCTVVFIPSIKKMEWKKHFPQILMLFAMLLVQTIFCASDITMLGIMKSDYIVGLYSTSTKIYNLINQIMASILWVMLPELTGYYVEKDYGKINNLLKKGTQFMLGLGMPCIMGGIFLSDEIVTIIGGDEYIEASIYLKILMIALFFSLIGGSIIGNMILLPSKREKYFLQACTVAAIANIILNLILVEKYEALAASATTLFSHIIIFVMLLPKVEKEIHIGSFKDNMLAPLVGSGIIAIICIVIKTLQFNNWITFILAMGVSASVYAIILLGFKYELFMLMCKTILVKIYRKIKG